MGKASADLDSELLSCSFGQHHADCRLNLDDAPQPQPAFLPCQVTTAVGLKYCQSLAEDLVLSGKHACAVGGLEASESYSDLG